MGDKINGEYFAPDAAAFNYNNVTGGADSASGGSGGSGMECLQLRSPPGPAFHYLISEQAKSLVALQELQNEVGALLEFRDLVIETFPNLRSKMAPSTPASDTRRDWEPGVRVRRKLAAGGGDGRAKPQPSVQDSGFSTETSCKEAHSASAPPAPRPRPLEDELWALLDVIQRKGVRLRDEAELLRGELDDRHSETAEDSFARALSTGGDRTDLVRLRSERDALLAHAARLEAEAEAGAGAGGGGGGGGPTTPVRSPPLGRLDRALAAPARTPRVNTPDSKKFTAILQESNPVELRRQLLISTVQNQSLREAAAARGAMLAARLRRARDARDDLAFRLEEKSIELEGALARVRQLEAQRGVGDERGAERGLEWGDERSAPRGSEWGDERGEARGLGWSDERGPERGSEWSSERGAERGSMRDLRPLALPGDPAPRTRPSRIPRHKGAAPRPPAAPSRPPSSQSVRSARSVASGRSRQAPAAAGPGGQGGPAGGARKDKCSVPVRRSPSHDSKVRGARSFWNNWFTFKDS